MSANDGTADSGSKDVPEEPIRTQSNECAERPPFEMESRQFHSGTTMSCVIGFRSAANRCIVSAGRNAMRLRSAISVDKAFQTTHTTPCCQDAPR